MSLNPKENSPMDNKPKKAAPSGPAIKVEAFVALMKRLEADKEHLTNEQVRFIQNAVQRFEHETDGMVKTKHVLPKPKKPKHGGLHRTNIHVMDGHMPSQATKGFIERLVRLASEDEAMLEIQHLSAAEAERLAREQGLRAYSPDIARQKLAETVVTLREIERIAGAGKPQS
jgi:fatty acid-binding protein DegV